MAKSASKNKSIDSVQKKLNSAARLLNQLSENGVNESSKRLTGEEKARKAKLYEVEIHQAYCTDEGRPIGEPTTDKTQAKTFARLHELQTGHDAHVVTSEI